MFQQSSHYVVFKNAIQKDDFALCQTLIHQEFVSKNQALILAINGQAFRIASWLILDQNATLYHDFQELVDLIFSTSPEKNIQISYEWLSQHFPHFLDRSHIQSFFLKTVSRGYLTLAKWSYQEFGISLTSQKNIYFKAACSFGHLEVAKWLFKECPDTAQNIYWSISQAVSEGYLPVVKWLITEVAPDTDIHQSGEHLLRIALKTQHREIAIFLIEYCQADPMAVTNYRDEHLTSPNEALELVSYLGDTKMVEYLINYYQTHRTNWDVHLNDDFLLISNGLSGNPTTLEMIYQIDPVGFNIQKMRYCFSEVVSTNVHPYGTLPASSFETIIQPNLEWLWDKAFPTLDIDSLDWIHEFILECCEKGTFILPKFKWLLKKSDLIDLHYQEDRFFIRACQMGRLENAKLLYQYGEEINSPIHVRSGEDSAFYRSIEGRHFEITSWLAELNDAYYFHVGHGTSLGSFEIHGEDDDLYEDKDWLELAKYKKMTLQESKQHCSADEVCSICLIPCEGQPHSIQTSCGHWFCSEDFFCWVTEKQRMHCPLCRQRFQFQKCVYYS